MSDENQTTLDRRDMIAGELSKLSEDTAALDTNQTAESTAQARARDEVGRFAKVEAEKAQTEQVQQVEEAKPPRKPPSSWKKDYHDHWGKIVANPELSPLADYIEQREGEFAKGVSAYKAEADRAAVLNKALEPYMPVLNQHGVQPADFISKLGQAHVMLVQSSPDQKLAIFQQLARDYGVSFDGQGQAQQVDPTVLALQQQVRQLSSGWQQFQQSQQQAQEAQFLEQIKAMQEGGKHPHFEAVRDQMARLLESGMAPDLQSAYEQAVWLNPETRNAMQQTAAQQNVQEQAAAAARAQAKAVSPKSATPRAQPASASGNKDRRTLIAEQLSGAASRV